MFGIACRNMLHTIRRPTPSTVESGYYEYLPVARQPWPLMHAISVTNDLAVRRRPTGCHVITKREIIQRHRATRWLTGNGSQLRPREGGNFFPPIFLSASPSRSFSDGIRNPNLSRFLLSFPTLRRNLTKNRESGLTTVNLDSSGTTSPELR